MPKDQDFFEKDTGNQQEPPRKKSVSILKNKKVLIAISITCFLIAAVSLFIIIQYLVSLERSNEEYEQIRSEAISTGAATKDGDSQQSSTQPVTSTESESSQVSTQETQEEDPIPSDDDLTRSIDFEYLQSEVNADIYAWIYIPDSKIDYPVLQHPTDDSRYLNYNVDGSKGYPGCIYTERVNSKDFSDFNTLIYGHNMKNGSMFHGLHEYADQTYFEEHPYVYLYLPDKTLKYQIFAAYQYDDRHIMYSFDFTSEAVKKAYLKNIFETRQINAVVDKEVAVTWEDSIITMSTCVSGTDYRYLVQAVLLEQMDINES